jgi:ankyrin repeat protein
MTPDMRAAVCAGDVGASLELLQGGEDPGRADGEGVTPLLLAAQLSSRGPVAGLLLEWHSERGADIRIDARDASGNTALFYSVFEKGDASLMRRLLRAGADPNVRGANDCPPLIAASVTDDADKVELLLSHGADIELKREYDTALHAACMCGCVGSARTLVERGADVNARSSADETPLMRAADVAIVRLLIRAGADLEASNSNGWTVMHTSAFQNAHEAVGELLAAGANPAKMIHGGITPLSLALGGRHAETIRRLLAAGAGPPEGREFIDLEGWHFMHACQARWLAESEAALAQEREALPHLLTAAANKRPCSGPAVPT